jgi:endonuclease YncB( thermonuclease family)
MALVLAGAALPASAQAATTAPCRLDGTGPRCTVWTGRVTFVADGDTLDVDLAGDGTSRPVRIRVTGIQAMEQTSYSKYPSRRRGECHALEATARLERLVKAGRRRVRVAAQHTGSHAGNRLRRSIAVRLPSGWRDAGEVLVAEGHALWLPNPVEYAWNATYSALAQQAARAQVNLWDPDGCGAGPAAGAPLEVGVNWDARGRDDRNVNGEWIDVRNAGGSAVSLAGWWVRDSHLRRHTFPAGAAVPAGGRVRVHVGRGSGGGGELYWGLDRPAFENATFDERALGDGGYLFDPRGNLRGWDMYPCRHDC